MTTKQEVLNEVERLLLAHFEVESLKEVKQIVKKAAKYEYGCTNSHIKVKGGLTIIYTDNPNCFASYIVRLQGVGMASEYALESKDITQAGRSRGCHGHYLFNSI